MAMTESIESSVTRWLNAAEVFSNSVGKLKTAIDEEASRSQPISREAYLNAYRALQDSISIAAENVGRLAAELRETEDELGQERFFGLEGYFDPERALYLFDVLDSVDKVATNAKMFDDALSTHRVVEMVSQSVAKTLSDEIKRYTRTYEKTRGELLLASDALAAEVMNPAGSMNPPGSALDANPAGSSWPATLPQNLSQAFGSAAPRGAYSTMLYAKMLDRLGAANLIEGLIESTLGGSPDSEEAIDAAIENRRVMHPIQAMGLTFGLKSAQSAQAAQTTQAAQPTQAAQDCLEVSIERSPAIEYRLDALLDKSNAPLKSAGLNFNVIRRLDTISEARGVGASRGEHMLRGLRAPRDALCLKDGSAVMEFAFAQSAFAQGVSTRGAAPVDVLNVLAGPRKRVFGLGNLGPSARESPQYFSEGILCRACGNKYDPEAYARAGETLEPRLKVSAEALATRIARALDLARSGKPVHTLFSGNELVHVVSGSIIDYLRDEITDKLLYDTRDRDELLVTLSYKYYRLSDAIARRIVSVYGQRASNDMAALVTSAIKGVDGMDYKSAAISIMPDQKLVLLTQR